MSQPPRVAPEIRTRERALITSELRVLSQRYGLDLGASETRAITESALRNLQTATQREARQRIENAFLEYFRSRDPARAAALFTQIEGQRYYYGLGIHTATISVQGRQTSVEAALMDCSSLSGEARLRRFMEIISQVGERFRVRGQPPTNLFGLRYDLSASDPEEALTQRAFNCFSGTIVLGQIMAHMAARALVQDDVRVALNPVAAYTIGRGLWNDAGHSILRVECGARTVFFDSTNEIDRNQAASLQLSQDGVLLRSMQLGSVTAYRLQSARAIDESIVAAARLQDRLFDSPSMSAADVYGFPPFMLSYYVAHLTPDQQLVFFRRFRMQQVRSPSFRYRLAATAAVAYQQAGDSAAAARSAATALTSLGQAINAGGTEFGSLPMGSFLETTMTLIDIAGRTPEGIRQIEASRVWAYLSYVANHSSGEIPAALGTRVRDFLSRFCQQNLQVIQSEPPGVILNLASGLLTACRIAGSGNETADNALSALYIRLGIHRGILQRALTENARQTTAMDLNPEIIQRFLSVRSNVYELERGFLMAAERILDPSSRFNLENIRTVLTSLNGEQAILGQGVYRTLANQESISSILMAYGPFREACIRRNLIRV